MRSNLSFLINTSLYLSNKYFEGIFIKAQENILCTKKKLLFIM